MARIEVSTGRGFTLAGVAYTKAVMSSRGRRFRPRGEKPKTYKDCGGFVCPELSSPYNSGCVHVYKASDGTYRFSVYRDGCFYPYYGKIEFYN